MIRLFFPPERLSSNKITITGEDARHLITVLRSKPGDSVTILNGLGKRHICSIIDISKKEVVVEKIREEICTVESPVNITLAQGLTKGRKMDLIIQKTTELGVNRIVPLITERSQVRDTVKTERWEKIARSASQQSGREKIPEIDKPVDFSKFLKEISLPSPTLNQNDDGEEFTHKGIILSEEEKERNLRKILNDFQGTAGITLLIGPEGGFSKDEVTTAIQKGFVSASLGPRILRTETAPITAISIIQYELGDIG